MLHAKHRRESGQFIAEGPQAVREALALGAVVELYATAAAARAYPDLTPDARLVDDGAIEALADTVHSQGLIAVCDRLALPTVGLFAADGIGSGGVEGAGANLAGGLIAVGVRTADPGNAGVLIRCADATGATAVAFTRDSVDPFNSKAVRASTGSVFHLPVETGLDADDLTRLRGRYTILAADGRGDTDLDSAIADGSLARPTVWLFGNEAHGLGEYAGLADAVVSIPIYGRAESLNLATAAAVCLYASARAQRG